MKPQSASIAAVRTAQGVFLFTTAVYCLLAYLPFTYQQVHQANLFPALSAFGRWHPLLWWIVMGLAAWSVGGWGAIKARKWRTAPVLFTAVHLAVGVYLVIRPLTAHLKSPAASFIWCLLAFGSLAWTGILDWNQARGCFPELSSDGEGRLFLTALSSAVLVTFAFAIAAVFRMSTARPDARAILFSLDAHILMFLGVFSVLALARAISEISPWPAAAEFWILAFLAVLAGRLVLLRMFFTVVSLDGAAAQIVAATASCALVLFWSGLCARLYSKGEPAEDGLALFLLPLTFWSRRLGPLGAFGALALLLGAGCAASVAAAGMDWNYLAQKTSALFVWFVAFALLYRILGRGGRERTVAFLLIAIAVIGTHRMLLARAVTPDSAQYAAYDPSYKVLYDWMTPSQGSGDYYRVLARNTNLPRTRELTPVDLELTAHLQPKNGPRPHIFLFVIDSLRRDYLSPYNAAVDFTPSIASFARESVVEQRAFTRYAGTGLSEPSIWAGAMLPHKQYVTPFHPMNTLEKLLDGLGYQRFISFDTILAALLERNARTSALDESVLTMDLDFGRTLRELASRIEGRAATAPPVFAYTQPQNLHVSVINRAGRSVPQGESYPGFDAAYASRLKRVDAAFGVFIAFLKQKGWYANSIVILTADHGDSLGEQGRWGHAYSMVPEVVRIPLIVHLPDSLRDSNVSRPEEPSFLTDVTPTLYQLLGQTPLIKGDQYGKPLFAPDAETLRSYQRDHWLLASSYAPVYGILRAGRELYVSDAVQYREFAYQLGDSASAPRPLTRTETSASQELIRREIQAIATHYKTEPKPQASFARTSGL